MEPPFSFVTQTVPTRNTAAPITSWAGSQASFAPSVSQLQQVARDQHGLRSFNLDPNTLLLTLANCSSKDQFADVRRAILVSWRGSNNINNGGYSKIRRIWQHLSPSCWPASRLIEQLNFIIQQIVGCYFSRQFALWFASTRCSARKLLSLAKLFCETNDLYEAKQNQLLLLVANFTFLHSQIMLLSNLIFR